jgi:heme-degrading monooxygenase HmoA
VARPGGTAVELFEVGPGDDDAFLAAWDGSGRRARLFRALREDVTPRFVAVGGAGGDRYEVLHEAGDVEGSGGVVVIDLHQVAEADDEPFVAAWRSRQEAMAATQGHLGARLCRSVEATEFRFVALARWSSPLMVARARREDLAYDSRTGVYEVVRG